MSGIPSCCTNESKKGVTDGSGCGEDGWGKGDRTEKGERWEGDERDGRPLQLLN